MSKELIAPTQGTATSSPFVVNGYDGIKDNLPFVESTICAPGLATTEVVDIQLCPTGVVADAKDMYEDGSQIQLTATNNTYRVSGAVTLVANKSNSSVAFVGVYLSTPNDP